MDMKNPHFLSSQPGLNQNSRSPSKWWLAALCAATLYVTPGCGGGTPPPPGAKKELSEIKEAIDFSESNESRGMLNEALANMKDAARKISDAKPKATDREKTLLRGLEETVTDKTTDLENKVAEARRKREKAQEEADQKEALAKASKAKGIDLNEDPEKRKKREEDEARAKVDKQKAEDLAKLAATGTTSAKPKLGKKSEDAEESGGAAGGGDTPAVKGPDGKQEAKPVADTGPFKPLGEKPGPVRVELVVGKGTTAFAYIQVYNSNPDKNRRIGRVMVRFRDAGNTELFDADIVCQYDKFDPTQKDILDQNAPGAMLGMESHEVANQQALKLVAVAAQQKADFVARAKRCMVTVIWADGQESTEVGPSTMIDDKPGSKSGVLPGL